MARTHILTRFSFFLTTILGVFLFFETGALAQDDDDYEPPELLEEAEEEPPQEEASQDEASDEEGQDESSQDESAEAAAEAGLVEDEPAGPTVEEALDPESMPLPTLDPEATPSLEVVEEVVSETAAPAQAPVPSSEEMVVEAQEMQSEETPASSVASGPDFLRERIDGFKKGVPLSLSLTMGNSVGIGTFVGHDFARAPSWSSSVNVLSAFSVPKIWVLPKFSLSGSATFYVPWLVAYNDVAYAAPMQMRAKDVALNLSVPETVDLSFIDMRLGAVAGVALPTSLTSRYLGRTLTSKAAIPVSWSGWGFTAGWTPSFAAYAYDNPNVTQAETSADGSGMPLLICRSEELLDDGQCRISGRQTLTSVTNTLATSWNYGDHTVSLSYAWALAFKRPLAEAPELKGLYASDQNFTERSLGTLAYTYVIPLPLKPSVTAGVSSLQGLFNPQGDMRFPFYDFITPANNFTEAFVDLSVGF